MLIVVNVSIIVGFVVIKSTNKELLYKVSNNELLYKITNKELLNHVSLAMIKCCHY